MIPDIIYQTYKTNQLPDEFESAQLMLKSLNPNHKYVYLTDDDAVQFIRDAYGEDMLQCYMRINPTYGPARADLLRYLLIYHTGGAYFDIKSAATVPLRDIIQPDDRFVLARWSSEKFGCYRELININNPLGREYQNWHIIGEAKHPILEQVITDVLMNIHNPAYLTYFGKVGVLRLTGPIAYTKSIYKVDPSTYRVLHNDIECGLRYNTIGKHYSQDHVVVFGQHYSKSREKIILPR